MKVYRCIAGVLAFALPVIATAQGFSEEIQPQSSELMPLADERLLLDVKDTGARLIAVGERGHVVGSLDGRAWVQVPAPTRATLTAVHFADENNGWAVGHDAVIMRTRDGGRSWVLQNFEPEKEQPFLDVLFLDAKRGFAVGAYAMFYHTHDGGETWEQLDTPIREAGWHYNSLVELNNGNLFIAGEKGTLAFSQDRGETWQDLESPYESSMFDAAPVGESGVLIAGLRGNVYYTADPADADWVKLKTDTRNSLIGAEQLPDGEVVMVGVNGALFRTSGGLASAQRMDSPTGQTLAAVQPLASAWVAVGDGGPRFIQP